MYVAECRLLTPLEIKYVCQCLCVNVVSMLDIYVTKQQRFAFINTLPYNHI